MSFLSPLALLGLALVALPVLIHLLVRRRAGRLDFPSLRFLRETPSFRLRPRRIQQPLLLALRLAAIILLVMGLARPLISLNSGTARTRVILLDASLSMRAQGRDEAAREQARNLIDNLAAGERAAIISFSSGAEVLSAMTSDKRELAAALERYRIKSGAASYATGFEQAAALLRSEQLTEARLDLISDFQQSGLTREHLPQLDTGTFSSIQIIAHPTGARLERNAFLMDESTGDSEQGSELSISEIIAATGGRSGARKRLAIGTGTGSQADAAWRTEANGQIIARIAAHAPDDFDADDERHFVITELRAARALLIGDDKDDAIPYLRAALEAAGSVAGQKRFTLERKSELPADAAELNAYSLITLSLRAQPRAEELRVLANYASGGGVVWMCASREVDTASWNEFLKTEDGRVLPFASLARKNPGEQGLSFGAADTDAPALRFAGADVFTALRAVRLREGFALNTRETAATLLRWNDGEAAMIEAAAGNGKMLLLGTSPARESGELGISASFPALVSSIARSSLEARVPLARAIGEPVNLRLAPEASVKIINTEGKSVTARARELLTRPEDFFSEPGVYRVETEKFIQFLAFNPPVAESETALAAPTEIERIFGQQKSAGEAQASAWRESSEQKRDAWRYFLLTAFLLLIAELFIVMRQQARTIGRRKDEG